MSAWRAVTAEPTGAATAAGRRRRRHAPSTPAGAEGRWQGSAAAQDADLRGPGRASAGEDPGTGSPDQELDGDRGRRRQPAVDGEEGADQPAPRPLDRLDRGRTGPGDPGQGTRPRVHLQRWAHPGGDCVEAVVQVADTYGVEIAPDQDPVVVLAATVAVDMMVHEGR